MTIDKPNTQRQISKKDKQKSEKQKETFSGYYWKSVAAYLYEMVICIVEMCGRMFVVMIRARIVALGLK